MLQSLLQSDEKTTIKNDKLVPNLTLNPNSNKEVYDSYFETITKNYQSNIKLQKQHYLPDINLEYFQGKIMVYHNRCTDFKWVFRFQFCSPELKLKIM